VLFIVLFAALPGLGGALGFRQSTRTSPPVY